MTEDLLGWVRRFMELEVERRDAEVRAKGLDVWPGLSTADREALAHAVMRALGGPLLDDTHGEHGLAWALCEAAGWPS